MWSEHFKKHHSPKCSECSAPFRTVDDFGLHRSSSCSRAGEETGHLCEVQLKAITAMPKRSQGVSPANKWEKIDHIIFDDDVNMRSPFVQSLEHLRHVIQMRPLWLDESLQISLSSDIGGFLADVEKLLHIVSRGRMTALPKVPNTSEGLGESSRDVTLPNIPYARDTSMEMIALDMGNDEYTSAFEDIDLNF